MKEYTGELYKKCLNDPDNHDGVITHLEPDILEWEVKWALGSITMNKASGGDGIPVELFQILKRWCCERAALNMTANLENAAVATGLEGSVFIPIPKKGNAFLCSMFKCWTFRTLNSNYHTIVLISHTSKVMFKILQARLQQFVNWDPPDVQAGFRKVRGTRDQIANIRWIIEKAREFQKNYLLLLYWLHQRLWLCGS